MRTNGRTGLRKNPYLSTDHLLLLSGLHHRGRATTPLKKGTSAVGLGARLPLREGQPSPTTGDHYFLCSENRVMNSYACYARLFVRKCTPRMIPWMTVSR